MLSCVRSLDLKVARLGAFWTSETKAFHNRGALEEKETDPLVVL